MKSLDDSVELCTQELTFNPSFYPSLVRMPMSRYRRNIWVQSLCPWRDIGENGSPWRDIGEIYGFNPSFCPSLVRMPMAEDLPSHCPQWLGNRKIWAAMHHHPIRSR